MKRVCSILLVYLSFSSIPATAQFSPYNLVPNPSFEQYTNCPYYFDILIARSDKPDIWYKPDLRGARFFHACANGFSNDRNGMPVNFLGGGIAFNMQEQEMLIWLCFITMVLIQETMYR